MVDSQDRVRAHWLWVAPLPDAMDIKSAGPLFCGGITVFHPLIQHKILPTSHVGMIGLGGLGHLAVQFLRARGCEVTVFTSSASKAEEARNFGAHHVVDANDAAELKKIRKSLDLILCTSSAALNWDSYLQVLAPAGILHIVGVPPSALEISAFQLIGSQRSVSGSSLGSPSEVKKMLEFCVLHNIRAQVEYFKMNQVNEAMEHTRSGKVRYRSVLVV